MQLLGLNTFLGSLKAVQAKHTAGVIGAIRESALDLQATAKINCSGPGHPRVQSGDMRRSIQVLWEKLISEHIATVMIGGTSAPYALPVEVGTRKMPAYPFVGPAISAVTPRHEARMKKAMQPW